MDKGLMVAFEGIVEEKLEQKLKPIYQCLESLGNRTKQIEITLEDKLVPFVMKCMEQNVELSNKADELNIVNAELELLYVNINRIKSDVQNIVENLKS